MTGSNDVRLIRHFIDGAWTGEPARERRNPAVDTDVVAVTAIGDVDVLDDAVTAATQAQPAWAALPGPARGAVLARAAHLLRERSHVVARDLTREEGKTLTEATGEVNRAADILDFFGAECWRASGVTLPSPVEHTEVFTRREPLGVVGLITPWNFPIAIPTWKLAPALAAGNAVVMKPAELTPVSTWHLTNCLDEAGLPHGVLNLIHGPGRVLGDALVRHEGINGVSFTGSNAVGTSISALAGSRGVRVQTEMGGKNPVIVLDDADPNRAAEIVAGSAFGLTGQACTAASRVICTPGIYQSLREALVAHASRIVPGDGLDPRNAMGPVVSQAQLQTDIGYVSRALDDGGSLVTGAAEASGNFLAPVIIDGVSGHSAIAQEEVFGPVLVMLPADNLDDAIQVANDTPFGLSASIVTDSLSAVHDFVAGIKAGVVKVNRPTGGVDLNVPFGGVKGSSNNIFREQGSSALDFYSWVKSVYVGRS